MDYDRDHSSGTSDVVAASPMHGSDSAVSGRCQQPLAVRGHRYQTGALAEVLQRQEHVLLLTITW